MNKWEDRDKEYTLHPGAYCMQRGRSNLSKQEWEEIVNSLHFQCSVWDAAGLGNVSPI